MAKTRVRRKRTATAPANETARQKFLRVGQPRMNRALTAITLIGNLSAPQYEWDEADMLHIKMTLMSAVSDVLQRFELRLRKERRVFHFSPSTMPASDAELLGLETVARVNGGDR